MELSKVAWELNRIYEKQLMMRMGSHFIIITGLLYNLFTLIFFVKETFNDTLRIIISTAIWFGVYCYRFLKLNSTCARVSSEVCKVYNLFKNRIMFSSRFSCYSKPNTSHLENNLLYEYLGAQNEEHSL